MPISPHCILGKIFWSSFPERGWWDDTKQLDHDTVWGQTQLAFLWEKQTIVNWVSKKRVLERKLYSICGGEKQNSDSLSTARIFKNKQTRKQSKARLAVKGTCGFSWLRLRLCVDLLLPERPFQRMECPFSETASQAAWDLVRPHVGRPQRASRAPYWFESPSFKMAASGARRPLKPSLLWGFGQGWMCGEAFPRGCWYFIPQRRPLVLHGLTMCCQRRPRRGRAVSFLLQTVTWRCSWPKPAVDVMAVFSLGHPPLLPRRSLA